MEKKQQKRRPIQRQVGQVETQAEDASDPRPSPPSSQSQLRALSWASSKPLAGHRVVVLWENVMKRGRPSLNVGD